MVTLSDYGVATISTLLKIIGFFCRIWSLLYGSFAKETYYFKEPTNRSHPVCLCRCLFAVVSVCVSVSLSVSLSVCLSVEINVLALPLALCGL